MEPCVVRIKAPVGWVIFRDEILPSCIGIIINLYNFVANGDLWQIS